MATRLFRSFPLILIFFTQLAASDISVNGSSSLNADSQMLRGELILTLQGDESIYAVSVSIIGDGGEAQGGAKDLWQPGDTFPLNFNLDRRHEYPGLYQLLIEVKFRDRANNSLTVNLNFPYAYNRVEGTVMGPLLAIVGNQLLWGESDASDRLLGVDLTTGPHWKLTNFLVTGANKFKLERLPGHKPQPNFSYNQLASIKWLGSDGYHYSRVISWVIQTDARGEWIQSSSERFLHQILLQSSPMLFPWLLLIFGSTLTAAIMVHRGNKNGLVNLFGLTSVLALTFWLITYTHPELWFQDNWPTGGDLASHILYAAKFKDWLFTGKISGWMPEVYAGFPAFRYYFPFPFVLISLVSLALPIQIAIKIIVMIPALLVPLAVYWMGGRFRWTVAVRLYASLFSAGFLIHGGSTIWGGNLLAQLAGEFSYSWGLLLTLLFWGSLVWALRTGGRSWIVPALIEVLVGLSHGYSLLITGFSALLLPLFAEARTQALLRVLKIHFAAFLLLGFWLLPLIENLPYTIPNDTATWVKNFNAFIPKSMLPLLLGMPFLFVALGQRNKALEIKFLVLVSLLSILSFVAAYAIGLADIRFIPFAQLTMAIALGASVGLLLERRGKAVVHWSFAFAALLLINIWMNGMDRIEQWSMWNLKGYEDKAMWKHYQALALNLAGDPSEPRILFEHHPANQDLGSTRALEALPLFGSRPVLEGLYMEAAVSGPFIYQMQAQISQFPSSPLSRFPSVKGIQRDIADQMMDFYADTIVVRSEQSVALLSAHSDFELAASFGPFTVFKLTQTPSLIEVERNLRAINDDHEWLRSSFKHYLLDDQSSPRPVYGLAQLPENKAAFIKIAAGAESNSDSESGVKILSFSDERVKFLTDRPHEPHLIRITYHPGWKSVGGETIYKTAPAFMLVFPTSTQIDLVFSKTRGQYIGLLFSSVGFLFLLFSPAKVTGLSLVDNRRGYMATTFLVVLGGAVAYYFHPGRNYMAGHDLFAQQNFRQASAEFDLSVARRQLGTQTADALFWAARSYEMADNMDSALIRYQRLVDQHPESYWTPESLFRLALLYARAGEEQAKLNSLKLLLTHFPGSHWTRQWQDQQH